MRQTGVHMVRCVVSRYIKLADALRALADTCYLDEIDENMQKLPSIDIVFCKECKYYEAKEDWCYWRDEAITADDFCSYGEREGE